MVTSIGGKPDKQDMEKQVKRNLYYFKNQQKIIDAQKTKAEMVALRRNWLKMQNMKNYTSEYDRIRQGLDQSTLARVHGTPTEQHIKDRITKLRDLGTKALGDHGIID